MIKKAPNPTPKIRKTANEITPSMRKIDKTPPVLALTLSSFGSKFILAAILFMRYCSRIASPTATLYKGAYGASLVAVSLSTLTLPKGLAITTSSPI